MVPLWKRFFQWSVNILITICSHSCSNQIFRMWSNLMPVRLFNWSFKLSLAESYSWQVSRDMWKPRILPEGPTWKKKWRRVLCTSEFYAAAGKKCLQEHNFIREMAFGELNSHFEEPQWDNQNHLSLHILSMNSHHTCRNRSFIMQSNILNSGFSDSLSYWWSRSKLAHQCHVKLNIGQFCPKGPPERKTEEECFAPLFLWSASASSPHPTR